MLFRTFTAATVLALGMTAAHADDNSSTSTDVAIGDLNLSKAADGKILDSRLQAAAKSVCSKANPENVYQSVLKKCINAAISDANAQILNSMEQSAHAVMVNVRAPMETPGTIEVQNRN